MVTEMMKLSYDKAAKIVTVIVVWLIVTTKVLKLRCITQPFTNHAHPCNAFYRHIAASVSPWGGRVVR